MAVPPLFSLVLFTFIQISLSDKNCTCVPFFHCDMYDDSIITDGRGLMEIRNSKECEGIFEVCCDTAPITTTTPQPKKEPKGCGLQGPDSFPWSSTLLHKQYPNFVPSYKCRVSLIHERVAITAAHCLREEGYYQVRISNTIRSVVKTIKHPLFKPSSLHNDIAILVLNKPFKLRKIGTVCIPPPGTVLDGVNCTIATRVQEKEDALKVVELPVVARGECVGSLRRNCLGEYFQLHESFICAGGEKDTQLGDGGGALICPILPGRYLQAGIVSWGIGCDGSSPGVYVDLAHFRDWIDDVMVENNFDISSYRI